DDAALGQAVAVVSGLDKERRYRRTRLEAPHRPARQHDVIAVAEGEMAEVAEEVAGAVVDEEQLVAVAVADEMVHLAAHAPVADADLGIAEEGRRLPRRRLGVAELVEVEGARPQAARPVAPAGRRVRVIHLRDRAEEPFLAELALEGAGRQVGVGLARGDALAAGEPDPAPHCRPPVLPSLLPPVPG